MSPPAAAEGGNTANLDNADNDDYDGSGSGTGGDSSSIPRNDILSRYNDLLDRKPVLTKSLTSAFVGALGAALGSMLTNSATSQQQQQQQQMNYQRGRVVGTTRSSASNLLMRINWLDVFAFALHGGLLNGPINHYWFEWLEKNGPKSKSKSMLLDQFIVQPPLLVLMFVFLDMTRAAVREIPSSLNRTLATVGPTIVSSWRVWPVVVYCTFKYLKKKHYTVALNLCSIAWTVYLSKASKGGKK